MKHVRKSQSKFPKIFFFEKNGQKVKCCVHAIATGLENAKNYTIFKALGKKSGSRKQVHLWQISKNPSYNTINLIKILQDNAFFTRLKKHPKIPICSTFMNNKNCETLKEKIRAWYIEFWKSYYFAENPYCCSIKY